MRRSWHRPPDTSIALRASTAASSSRRPDRRDYPIHDIVPLGSRRRRRRTRPRGPARSPRLRCTHASVRARPRAFPSPDRTACLTGSARRRPGRPACGPFRGLASPVARPSHRPRRRGTSSIDRPRSSAPRRSIPSVTCPGTALFGSGTARAGLRFGLDDGASRTGPSGSIPRRCPRAAPLSPDPGRSIGGQGCPPPSGGPLDPYRGGEGDVRRRGRGRFENCKTDPTERPPRIAGEAAAPRPA